MACLVKNINNFKSLACTVTLLRCLISFDRQTLTQDSCHLTVSIGVSHCREHRKERASMTSIGHHETPSLIT